MNIYEFNKGMYAKTPRMEDKHAIKVINRYLDEKISRYYMLLNHDIHYFTLFHVSEDANSRQVAVEVLDICLELGDIVDVLNNQDTGMLEVWIRKDDEILMFGLFDYERGVIEVGP